jgi:hypothetical protein
MDIESAKQKLIGLGVVLKNSDRPLRNQPTLVAAIGEITSVAAMLDGEDPKQAVILSKVFETLDELKLAQEHWSRAASAGEDAYVLLVQYETTLAKT